MFPCYLQFSGSGSDGLEMKQKTGPNIMTITFLPPISGLSVLTGENTTIPIWKICSDNMIVSPEHGHTWLFEKKEFQISRYYLVRSDLIWDKYAWKESESYIFVIDCDKWKVKVMLDCWKGLLGQIDWQRLTHCLTLMPWPTWAFCLLFSEEIKRKKGSFWRMCETHPKRAFPPSLAGEWIQGRPWRRWGGRARSGWRSSRGFSSWSAPRRWCQGKARDSSRRSLHSW